MTDRRYGDKEMREIFSLATTGDARDTSLVAAKDGLTLHDLQRIGAEAGIEPERVARAAAMLDARGQSAPVQRMLGLAVGVSRTVPLPRAPTDREWEQLIAQFRTTFGVQGVASTTGGLREWSYGSLHISVEPTANGEQLRLTIRNEAAVALNGLGIAIGGLSLFTSAIAAASGKPEKALAVLGILGGVAALTIITNVMRAPRWLREWDEKLKSIAEQTVKLLSDGSRDSPRCH